MLGDAFVMNESKQVRYRDLRLYDRHSVWSCEFQRGQEPTPVAETLFRFDGVLRAFTIPQMIGEMDFFALFPNLVILLYQLGSSTSYLTYSFWPLAVDRTLWEIRVHFREPLTLRERLRQEYFKCTYRDTLQEDTAMHESLHAGLASRAKSPRDPAGQRARHPPLPPGAGRAHRRRAGRMSASADAQETQAADALPEGFADLAPWLGWALAPESARTAKRVLLVDGGDPRLLRRPPAAAGGDDPPPGGFPRGRDAGARAPPLPASRSR